MWSFYKTLLKNPRSVGALSPSSSSLSRTLAQFIPQQCHGLIVELGAGTGVITQAILDRGIAPERLIAIESSKDLTQTLIKRFPQVTILNKNACELNQVLGHLANQIDVLISTLPLLSLPESDRFKIMHEIETLLRPDSYYMQYSYRKSLFDSHPQFKKIASKRVWCNFPPARIDVFQKLA